MPHTSVFDVDGMAAERSVGPTFCNFLGGSVEVGLFFTGDIAGRFAGTVSGGLICVAQRAVDCTELEETGCRGGTRNKGFGLGVMGECEYKQFCLIHVSI